MNQNKNITLIIMVI